MVREKYTGKRMVSDPIIELRRNLVKLSMVLILESKEVFTNLKVIHFGSLLLSVADGKAMSTEPTTRSALTSRSYSRFCTRLLFPPC